MTLKGYQVAIVANTLYEVSASNLGTEQLNPNIFVRGGTIDLYGSNSATVPTQLSEMTLSAEDQSVESLRAFDSIPRYIAFVGDAEEVVLSGVQVKAIDEIS